MARVHQFLREQGKKIVWLVGDSSLDNKHWLFSNRLKNSVADKAFAPAVNGLEHVLQPPKSVQDVAHFVNVFLASNGLSDFACLCCAVEESTVADRYDNKLAPSRRVCSRQHSA